MYPWILSSFSHLHRNHVRDLQSPPFVIEAVAYFGAQQWSFRVTPVRG